MKTMAAMGLVIALVGLVALKAPAEFRAGVAVRTVNPGPLLPVSGGAGTPRPATKRIGDLTVRALVLEENGVRLAIVGADFLGFPGVLCKRVRAQVPGIPPENILIGSTHTHSAPDMYGFVNEKGETGADVDYIAMVCDRMAEAINAAVDGLAPAGVKIATDKARGKIAYNYYAEQLYDPRMSVIQAVDAGGKPIATLVNYATHPEVIGPGQGILCPDLCGPLYERIEAKGGGTALFMNGAQGGMVTADCRGPDDKDVQTWDECIRIGHLMADEALRIVQDAPVRREPGLFCAATTITFPVDSDLLLAVVRESPLGFEVGEDHTIATQVNVVNLCDAQILTIPGEALPNVGYYLKRNMHGAHNLLFGLTNDAFGYMLAKVDWDSFDRYDYITRTCLGEMTAEIFMEEALKLVDASPRPKQP